MMDASLALVLGSTPYTFLACMTTPYEGISNTTLGSSADLALTQSSSTKWGLCSCHKLNNTRVYECRATRRVQQQQQQQQQLRVCTILEVGIRVGKLHRDGVGQGEHKDVEEAGQVGLGVLGRHPHGIHDLPVCTHTHYNNTLHDIAVVSLHNWVLSLKTQIQNEQMDSSAFVGSICDQGKAKARQVECASKDQGKAEVQTVAGQVKVSENDLHMMFP